MLDILQLNDMLMPELRDLAEQIGLKNYKRLNKKELIYKILDHQALVAEGKTLLIPKKRTTIRISPKHCQPGTVPFRCAFQI